MKEIFVTLGLLAAVGLLLFYTMFGSSGNGGVNNDIKSTNTATHNAITNVNNDLTTLP